MLAVYLRYPKWWQFWRRPWVWAVHEVKDVEDALGRWGPTRTRIVLYQIEALTQVVVCSNARWDAVGK